MTAGSSLLKNIVASKSLMKKFSKYFQKLMKTGIQR